MIHSVVLAATQQLITVNSLPPSGVVAIIVAVLGLLLSAFNSGSELAFFSLSPDDIESIDDETIKNRVSQLLSAPDKLLATILIGNNLVNVMIVILLNYAMNLLFTFNSNAIDFLFQTVVMTFLILLFGEIIPKLYAQSYNVAFASFTAAPLQVMVKLFSPLTRLMVGGMTMVNRFVTQQPDAISTRDLASALEAGTGTFQDEKILKGILTFGDKTVSEIMRPRAIVVDLDFEDKFDDVVKRVIDTGYSRMPVYDGNPDNIKGILYAKDLLPYIGKRDNDFRWQNLMRPAYYVPETRMLDDLLEDFRRRKMHVAIVVDEFGCTQGIATLEDILEEIVGEIDDEYDTEEKYFTRLGENVYMFDAITPLADFTRILDISEDELGEVAEDAETIAGLLLAKKGDFLRQGEVVTINHLTFTVMKVAKYRIEKVKVERTDNASS